ncbi:MAG: PfkB family carbohydrate kinase, partial [Actinomycetota bacterium]
MRVAVVGHNEWIEFARVDHVPVAGEIVHAAEGWEEPGGGGAVAAVQLARLAGSSTFLTAVGEDERGIWTGRDLTPRGVQVRAAVRGEPTRRAVVFVDANGERTIATLGRRLEPEAADHLPWEELEGVDAVYFTAGDDGALRHARGARVLVATSRAMKRLAEADVELDAIVGSARDAAERYDPSGLS